jgi:DNA polymerase elongation subunit (family B)
MENINEFFAYHWNIDPIQDYTQIRIYGISRENEMNVNVCVRVENFTPYVYIQLPDDRLETVTGVKEAINQFILYSEVMYKSHLYNFENKSSSKLPFLFCQCRTKQKIQKIQEILKYGIFIPTKGKCYFKVHETAASAILQMVSLKDLPMAGWIKFDNANIVIDDQKITSCDYEFIVKWKDLKKSNRIDQIIPKILAFDIEVNSEFINKFPDNCPKDAVFQISCVIESKEEKRRKLLLSLKASDMNLKKSELLKDVKVLLYENEEELLLDFIRLIDFEKPNVITGFNIFGFDIEYIMKRCVRFCLSDELKSIGFNKDTPAQIEKVKWSSSAYKNQEFNFLNWEGILLLDLLPLVRRDYKLDTYTLKNVTATFLNNDTKDPVTYKDIFTAYQTREKLDIVGKYCVQDSNLCIELMKYFHSWIALAEMAKVCNVSMFTLYTQGQQIKIYSQVYKYCLKQNIVVNSDGYQTKANERYTGAYVHEPIPDYYENVVPLDYNSLYPSIMIAQNICYSTIANDDAPDEDCNIFEWEDHIGCDHDPKIIEIKKLSSEIEKIDWDIKKLIIIRDLIKKDSPNNNSLNKNLRNTLQAAGFENSTLEQWTLAQKKKSIQKLIDIERKKQKPFREARKELKKSKPTDREDDEGNKVSGIICAKRYYRFLKATVKKGVIPTIIQNLLDSRKQVKDLMKKADPIQKIVYDKEQLAYKVSANSMYGGMGVRRGYLPFMPGAMCVTYYGRETIKKTADIIVDKWKGKLVYIDTDSNYIIFPDKITIQETWDYALKVAKEVSKEFPEPMTLEFENTIYKKFLILSKKRYMYQESDRDGNLNQKIGKKGVILARRDNSNMLKHVYEKLASLIFDKIPPHTIELYLIEFINNIFRNIIPHQDYVITKSVGEIDNTDETEGRLGDYKVKQLPEDEIERKKILKNRTEKEYYVSCCPAQVQLAEKMRKRGIPVDAGSRIEYIVIQKLGATTLGERIEDYDYFKIRSRILKIDPEYYLRSLINPLDQMLAVGIKNNHFVKDQYDIRMKYLKVVSQIKKLGRPKIIKN